MPPTEQKVLVLDAVKAPFTVQTKPVDKPGSGQLVVRVEATGLNPADWLIREYGVPWVTLPGILGLEGSGVVEEVGEGVENVTPGERM